MSQDATNGNDGVTLTVSDAASVPGGNTDPDYSPAYLGATLQNPGLAGAPGTSAKGRSGAIVLIW